MPIVVAAGLALLAIGNAIGALRGDLPARDSLDWTPIVLILGGLAALIVLIAARRRLHPRHRHPVRDDLRRLRTPGLPDRPPHRRSCSAVVIYRALRQAPDPVPAGRARSNACSEARHGSLRLPRPRPGRRHPADEPALRAHRRPARHRGRRAARHRPGAHRRAAPADHLQARSRQLDHHVRRHLLRRHVWRLDHLDPAQHARRERLHGDRPRRQQDGQGRPRRPGARHRRHRLLRGRHHRHARPHLPGALPRRHRRAVRPGGLLRPDVRRLRHRLGDLRRFARARPHQPVHRPAARPGRHRHPHRPGAPDLRRAGALRRHRGDDARGRPLRGRRGALRRLPPPRRTRRSSSPSAARSG